MMHRIFFILLSFLLLLPQISQAGSEDIALQGIIFDDNDDPLEGSHEMTFRIYDTEEGGTALWEDTFFVEFSDGIYLAALEGINESLFEDNAELFISVQVSNDGEMAPRLEVFSSGYARFAGVARDIADGAISDSVKIAAGTIESSDIAAGAIGATELASSGVTAGSYTLADITVDADGRITSVSNGSAPGTGDITGVTAGTGMTGGGASGDVTLNASLGTDITTGEIVDGTITSNDLNAGANIATATALAANGANCAAGQYPLGVDASGAVESCTVAGTGTVTNIATGTGLTGGAITTTGTLLFDYTATLAGDPALTSGQAVFDSGDSQGGILFEGDTANGFESLLTVAEPTADQTWTLPDATGTIALTSSNISGNAATATALAANGANCGAGQYPLGVDASGAVESCTAAGAGTVTSVDSGAGLTGGAITDSGTLAVGAGTGIAVNANDVQLSYAATLAGDPALTAGRAVFDSADSQGGLLFEGSTADEFESLLTVADPTDDRTWTLPDATGTIALTSSNISGTAATATALAANGGNCAASQYPLGVDASGAVESCTADDDTAETDAKVANDITVASTVTNAAGGSGNPIDVTSTLGIFDGSDDYTAMDINLTNSDHTGASNTVQALDINAITGDAQATETAIKVGDGWDRGVDIGTNTIVYKETGGGSDLLTLQAPASVTGDIAVTLPASTGTIALTTSNVSTATALAANGANCDPGEYPLGVDASGAVEDCTAAAGSGTVTSVATGAGLTGGPITEDGTVAIDYTATLGGDPNLGANISRFATTGIIFEGASNDGIEGLLTAADPTAADKTWTLPNVTGTLVTTGDSNSVTGAMTDESSLVLTGLVDDDDLAAGAIDGGAGGEIADASITTADISNSAGITDAQVSDTLTASIFVGSGSTTNAVDLGTAEVAGTLPLASLTNAAPHQVLGRRYGYALPVGTTAVGLTSYGMATLGALGTGSALPGAANRMYAQYASTTALNGTAGAFTGAIETRPAYRPKVSAMIRTSATITNQRLWGLALETGSIVSADVITTGGTSNTTFVAVGYNTGSGGANAGNWFCCAGPGTAGADTTYTCTDTTVAVATSTEYTLILDWTVDGTLTCSVNGTSVNHTTQLPTVTTTDLRVTSAMVNLNNDGSTAVTYGIAKVAIEQN